MLNKVGRIPHGSHVICSFTYVYGKHYVSKIRVYIIYPQQPVHISMLGHCHYRISGQHHRLRVWIYSSKIEHLDKILINGLQSF